MRLEQLTFTRFIAAIAIVIFHFGAQISLFNNGYVSFIREQANIGVSYFFVLSGFIMIVAYNRFNKIDTADYLKNRFARVYPLIAVSVIPFVMAYFLFPGTVTLTEIALNLSTLQAWIPGMATVGNYPLWSLTVEGFFYLCFPFLFNHFYKKYSIAKISVVVFIIWLVSLIVQNYFLNTPFYKGNVTPSHDLLYYFPVMHLNQFLIGNLAGLFFVSRTINTKRQYDIFVVIILAVLVLLLKYPVGLSYHNGFLALVFAPLIVVIAQNTGLITKLFCKKPLVFLGEISYAIYVLQIPVFETGTKLMEKFGITTNPSAIFCINFIILLVASAICHIYIELPLRNRIKNIRLKPVFTNGN
ncbi:acyltransferase family protein [Flavobacterium subsaxonicum]|uniref:acyltransferase family protein n=1 Tax=Flavobacterium subsaxonicum TaxID=426226 RepID=UPI00040BECF8|nr:acyltransferase [Flavobacterium subsaxonicum]